MNGYFPSMDYNPTSVVSMTYTFVAFHTMIRGSGKPRYIVGCARALAEKGAKVLVVDGLMYEQGAIPHQFYEILGSSPAIRADGRNLYDLICDYETLCAGNEAPPEGLADGIKNRLAFPVTRIYRNHVLPDVCGRASTIPDYDRISYLPGNNGDLVEVKERIDFHELFESHSGHEFFRYIREQLIGEYDFVLLNAPAGHQEISGILCGHMADVILAIDVDSPAVSSDSSFRTCSKLVQRARKEGMRPIPVKSVKGHDLEDVVGMIVETT